MHIAFVTHGSFDKHATLKRATGMATPLLDAGHKVTILIEDSAANREKVMLECSNAEVCWHPGGLSPLKERKLKQDALTQLQPDLVWICAVGLRNWMFRPKQGCVILADHSELFSSIDSGILRKAFYWSAEWVHLFSFDAHVCASRYLEKLYKRRLKLFGKRNKVHYSPYAYHPETMRAEDANPRVLLQRWKNRKAILYMGSFWENYGFWDMLHAFKNLVDQRDDFVAVFIGRGPEKEKGINWIKANKLNDTIHFEGYVAEEDLPSYFTATYAFLSPLRDTVQDKARCPSKLFMYLPYNKPVITCAIGEARELFGKKGHYFIPGSIDSLTDTLKQVLDSANGSSTVAPEEHTYKARVDAFLDWYEATYQ